MSEKDKMLKLEMYLAFLCQNNIEQTCLNVKNIIFSKIVCLWPKKY